MGFLLSLCLFSFTSIAKDIPTAPTSYVLDEPRVLSSQTKNQLFQFLSHHENTNGNQIVVAIFNSLDGEDLVDWTNKVFATWKIGKKGKDNGVLLALYWKDRKARIEVGYGLESVLTDAYSKRVISNALIPFLKQNRPNEAVFASVQQIVKKIQNPNSSTLAATDSSPPLWVLLALVSLPFLILIFIFLYKLKDTHISRTSAAHRHSRWFDDWGSGGSSSNSGWGGGWGSGGGGFSGGGGSSGGGGASGSW